MEEQEYLTFMLDGEEFGVDILCVQEIRVLTAVTELPNKPHYLKGVINLRGVIIPIVDLRERFGKQGLSYDEQTVIIILKSPNPADNMVVGLVVDRVAEVYKVNRDSVSAAPSFGSAIDNTFLAGLAKVEEKLILLLDMNNLLDQQKLYIQGELAS